MDFSCAKIGLACLSKKTVVIIPLSCGCASSTCMSSFGCSGAEGLRLNAELSSVGVALI